jgi:hypothetical protein
MIASMHGLLRSQKTGILCCFAAVALLGAGSFFMDARNDLYAGLRVDDLRFFFAPPRLEHVWLYLLMPVLALWGTNSLVCAYDTFRARLGRGVLHAFAHGPILLHVAFPLALVAHLWGGLGGRFESRRVMPSGATIAGVRLRPLAIHEERYPNGMPRQVGVTMERLDGGEARRVEIGYNRPLLLEAGARELMLADYAELPVAVVRVGGLRVKLVYGEPAAAGDEQLVLEKVYPPGSGLGVPVVAVSVSGPRQPPGRLLLPVGREQPGAHIVCEALETAPAVLLTERWNPSIPLVVFVAVLAAAGVLLCIRDHRRRHAEP